MIFRKKRRPVYHHKAIRAKAARAIFQEVHGAIPKIALTFIMLDDTEHTFELEFAEAGKMIEQAMSAYNAIMPPLKTSRGGFGL